MNLVTIATDGKNPAYDLVWNPLKKFPRNNQCFCGTGKKAKKCCMPQLSRTMLRKDAELVLSIWDGLLGGTEILEFRMGQLPKPTPAATDAVMQEMQ